LSSRYKDGPYPLGKGSIVQEGLGQKCTILERRKSFATIDTRAKLRYDRLSPQQINPRGIVENKNPLTNNKGGGVLAP